MITVKDIQEKEFATQAAGGYNLDEVDDFLDEVAARLGESVKENEDLKAKIAELSEELAAVKAEKDAVAAQVPDYDAEGYFNNVKNVMKESLVGAQRVADETIANAKRRAQETIDSANVTAEKTVAEADAYAKATTASAQGKVDSLNAEVERLRALAGSYAEGFRKMVEEQLKSLKEGEALLK